MNEKEKKALEHLLHMLLTGSMELCQMTEADEEVKALKAAILEQTPQQS